MTKPNDTIDQASMDSFPASDPPSWTPVTGTGAPNTANKVLTVNGQKVIHVECGHGEELRHHLASHGINTTIGPLAETSSERVEIVGTVDTEVLQAILDEWESAKPAA